MIKFTVAYHHKISMQKCPYGESCNNVISICIILYTAADLRLRLFCVTQQHENDIFVFSILIKSNARAKTKMLGDTMRLRKQMASICRGHFRFRLSVEIVAFWNITAVLCANFQNDLTTGMDVLDERDFALCRWTSRYIRPYYWVTRSYHLPCFRSITSVTKTQMACPR